jgi:hypothetical protein
MNMIPPKLTDKIAAKLDASPRVVVDWRDAWKWASTRSMSLAAATVTAWASLPAEWRDAVPHWVFAVVVVFELVLGIVGRVVVQTPPEDGSSIPSDPPNGEK